MQVSRFAKNLFAIIGFAWVLVSCTPIDSWWAYRLADPWGSGTGDVLVVLGGDNLGDDLLGESSYLRAMYTVRALRQHSYRRVIITGAHGVAGLMRDYVVAHSIPPYPRIEIEPDALSTRENALFVKKILGGDTGKVIMLTSDYHVARALRVFQKVGIAVEPLPAPDAIKRGNFWYRRSAVFVTLCEEAVKTLWYRYQGWA